MSCRGVGGQCGAADPTALVSRVGLLVRGRPTRVLRPVCRAKRHGSRPNRSIWSRNHSGMFPRLVTAGSGLLPLEDLVGRLDPVVPLFEDAGGALVAEAEARVGAVGVPHRDHRAAGLEARGDGEVGGGVLREAAGGAVAVAAAGEVAVAA